ncbi:hypothetical protein Rwratislav_39098 [Rhodococcus wratislaviensis IFP 2016]|nr:hypothetical protein Rwratislav_39098 [Rhodococcus wratislaviensis IFP 2016]
MASDWSGHCPAATGWPLGAALLEVPLLDAPDEPDAPEEASPPAAAAPPPPPPEPPELPLDVDEPEAVGEIDTGVVNEELAAAGSVSESPPPRSELINHTTSSNTTMAPPIASALRRQ